MAQPSWQALSSPWHSTLCQRLPFLHLWPPESIASLTGSTPSKAVQQSLGWAGPFCPPASSFQSRLSHRGARLLGRTASV